MITEDNLKSLLTQFQHLRILVIGDFYLDAYWYIDKTSSTLSLETPWHNNPVVEQRYSPGAAGTVTNNLNALGVGEVYTLGVLGDDGFGKTLLTCLNEKGCNTDYMIIESNSVTSTYLKPVHRGYESVETEGPRFDIENRKPMDSKVETKIINALHQCITHVDAIIIGDQMQNQNFGVITERVRDEICNLAFSYPQIIFFADSRKRIGMYRNVIIKPNRFEAQRALHENWDGHDVDLEEAKAAATTLGKKTNKIVYVTLGNLGILSYHNERLMHIDGVTIDGKIDPVGAGDSVTAAIVPTLCILGTENPEIAAYIGNLVASITITKIGTTGTASPDEILERYRSLNEHI